MTSRKAESLSLQEFNYIRTNGTLPDGRPTLQDFGHLHSTRRLDCYREARVPHFTSATFVYFS